MSSKDWMKLRRRTLFVSSGMLAGCLVDLVQHAYGDTGGMLHNSQQMIIAVLVGALVWSLMPAPPWQS